MLIGGAGVSVDRERAKGLYEKAIEEGEHVGATYNLDIL